MCYQCIGGRWRSFAALAAGDGGVGGGDLLQELEPLEVLLSPAQVGNNRL